MEIIRKFAQQVDRIVDRSELEIPQATANSSQLQVVLQIVFGIAGAVAVLMVVIGAFQYVISTGDPQKTAKAKNTILYALIGVAVAVSAQVIVSFVLDEVF